MCHDSVFRLNKSLYGLVQAPLYWGNHLKSVLEEVGFTACSSDPCLYVRDDVILLTYVDDVLLFAKNESLIMGVIQEIKNINLIF